MNQTLSDNLKLFLDRLEDCHTQGLQTAGYGLDITAEDLEQRIASVASALEVHANDLLGAMFTKEELNEHGQRVLAFITEALFNREKMFMLDTMMTYLGIMVGSNELPADVFENSVKRARLTAQDVRSSMLSHAANEKLH